MVTVHLEGEGRLRMQGEAVQIMERDRMPAMGSALGGRSEQLGAIPGNRGRRQAAQAEHVDARVERSLRRRVHRAIAEIRPRGGVRDYGDNQVLDRVLAGPLQGDRAAAAVGLAEELPQDLADVQGVRRLLAALALLLDPADDTRVEAQPRVEGEPAARHALVLGAGRSRGQAEAHHPLPALAQGVQQGAGGLHGIVGQAERAGEDIGGAAGHDGESGQPVGVGAGVQQPVDHLVDGAVAAERHDHVDVVALRGLPAQVPGVPPVLGGHRLQLHLAGERVDQHITPACACGGSRRIDHEKSTHARQGTYWVVLAPARGVERVRGRGVTLDTYRASRGPRGIGAVRPRTGSAARRRPVSPSPSATRRRLPCWGEQ
ncbi:hypothetical protein SGPA1_11865 [Streptomyces misionensis JCM 4497]